MVSSYQMKLMALLCAVVSTGQLIASNVTVYGRMDGGVYVAIVQVSSDGMLNKKQKISGVASGRIPIYHLGSDEYVAIKQPTASSGYTNKLIFSTDLIQLMSVVQLGRLEGIEFNNLGSFPVGTKKLLLINPLGEAVPLTTALEKGSAGQWTKNDQDKTLAVLAK